MKVALSAVAGLSEPSRGRERVQQRVDQAIHAYVSRTAPRSGKSLELFDFATTIAAARTVTPEIARVLSDDLDVEGKLDLLESFGLIFRNGFEGEPSWYFAPSVRLAFIQIRAEQGDGFEDPFQVLVHADVFEQVRRRPILQRDDYFQSGKPHDQIHDSASHLVTLNQVDAVEHQHEWCGRRVEE